MPAGPMEVAAYLKHRAAQGAKVATVRAALVNVRRSKTNQDGAAVDVRFTKNGFAAALLALRPSDAMPHWFVFGGLNGQSIGRRFGQSIGCLLYTSPSPRDATLSRMPSSA